jgi:carboxypeptidase Q
VYLQGLEAMRPIFESWLAPFRDMGVTTVWIRDTGGADRLSFAAVGLPGLQFIQDPLDNGTITHHCDMDTCDHAVPNDLMQASAVIATLVYQTATRAAAPAPPAGCGYASYVPQANCRNTCNPAKLRSIKSIDTGVH